MHAWCILVPKCQSEWIRCNFRRMSSIYPRVRTEYGIVHHPHREHDLDSRYWHLSFIHILNFPGWLQLDIGISLYPFFSISYPILSPILSYLSFVFGKRYLHGHSPPKPLIFSDVCSLVAATFVCMLLKLPRLCSGDLEWASKILRFGLFGIIFWGSKYLRKTRCYGNPVQNKNQLGFHADENWLLFVDHWAFMNAKFSIWKGTWQFCEFVTNRDPQTWG